MKTFEPVKPLTSHRGMPEDFVRLEETFSEDGERTGGHDLGDHSEGWASFAEILAHPRPSVVESGWLDLPHYKETLAVGKLPTSWSGGVYGHNLKIVDEKDLGDRTDVDYVRCTWTRADGLDNFIGAVKEIADKYGAENCRMIFGFDS